jgi:tRNA(Ile)-lysidine synthase
MRLYHAVVHELAERVRNHIRRQDLLKAGDRVGVAVSGGIDSIALLRLLLEMRSELGIVVSVVHFNHQMRGAESDGDQEFAANLAREHGLEFHSESVAVAEHARDEHLSLEAAARELRYSFFHYLLGEDSEDENSAPLDKLVTGHTLDDQAETVLMRLVRGTGLRGLGGIYPRLSVEDESESGCGEIIRPLLEVRRRELEKYLRDLGQAWREDSSNSDLKFTRNRMRHRVLPLLEKEFNPSVAEGLSELAEIARGEEDYWENEISGWLGTVVHWSEPEWSKVSESGPVVGQALVQIAPRESDLARRLKEPGSLVMDASISRAWFLTEPVAVQRRLVKAIGESAGIPLEFKHVEEILGFAAEKHGTGKELPLPLHWKLVGDADSLVFKTPDLRVQERVAQDYEYEFPLPGRCVVPEAGSVFEAMGFRPGHEAAGYNPQQLLDAEFVPGPLRVRNWRPGDRFWPAYTKSPKKIKDLLQDLHLAQPERRLWPVVVQGDDIVWVRGFPVPASLRAKPEKDAVLIRERLLTEDFAK